MDKNRSEKNLNSKEKKENVFLKEEKKQTVNNFFGKDWDYGISKKKKINFGFLKFNSLTDRSKIKKRYFYSFIFGLIGGLSGFLFLQGTGIYSLGISSLFQGLSRVFGTTMTLSGYSHQQVQLVYQLNFWVLNLIYNLAWSFFGYLKIGKQFTILSIIYVLTGSLFGLMLSLIPGWGDFFIFSSPLTYDTNLTKAAVQTLTWDFKDSLGNTDSSKLIILLIFGFFAGAVNAVATIGIYLIGGSTGGTDWYTFYYSKIKAKSVNTITWYTNIFITLISFLIGTFTPIALAQKGNPDVNIAYYFQNLASPILITTLLSAWLRKIIVHIFYKQFNVVIVKIYSTKVQEIRDFLVKNSFNHAFTINHSIGGYSLKKQTNIEIIVFYNEVNELLSYIRQIDEDCLFVAAPISDVNGYFRMKSSIN